LRDLSMQWPCELNKRASATCHPEPSRRISRRYLNASAAGSLGPRRTGGFGRDDEHCFV